jgi:hypothetical protein
MEAEVVQGPTAIALTDLLTASASSGWGEGSGYLSVHASAQEKHKHLPDSAESTAQHNPGENCTISKL